MSSDQPKFTPGPWKWDGDGFDSVAAEDMDTDGYTVMTEDCIPICEIDYINEEESKANTHIITASPKMYKALEGTQAMLRVCKDYISEVRHNVLTGGDIKAMRLDLIDDVWMAANRAEDALKEARGQS